MIPIWGSYHWVAPGETLYAISKRYNTTVQELVRVNRINNPKQIPVGLRLYIPQKTRSTVDVGAYIDPQITGDASSQVIDKVGEQLTLLTIFSYAVNRDGSLTPVNDQQIINTVYRDRVAPLMVLTNFEDGMFSQELATTILTNEALQDRVLDEAIRIMDQKGYLGLDFDFEYLGAENRERYNRFVQKARARLKEKGYFISSALAPKLGPEQKGVLYEGHDYPAHGRMMDFIFFMTYEWGWSGGPPMVPHRRKTFMFRKAIPIMVPATIPMRIPTPPTITMIIKNGTQEPTRKPMLPSIAVRMVSLRLRAGIVRKILPINPITISAISI